MRKLIGICLIVLLQSAAHADLGDYFGQYQNVTPAQPTQTGDKIEIVEMFWYGCPHCFRFEPYIDKMVASLPDDVVFRKVPAVFRKGWEAHAKAFYTASILGVEETMTPAIFNAIHVKRRRLGNMDDLADFFAERGVDRDKFVKTYRSFAVANKLRQAKRVTAAYGIDGVPAVIVNGKYRTSGSLTGGFPQMLKVIGELVDNERKS